MDESHDFEHDRVDWQLRPALLAALGALAALAVQQLLDRDRSGTFPYIEPAAWRIATATAIGTGAGALGFGLERNRWWWAAAFAGVVGALAGLIFYWNGGGWRVWSDWHTASLFLAIAIAVPLFQTARDQGGWRFPYAEVHGHAWTNVVLWCACWLFVGVVFALAWLLASLFDLIGLHFLRDLLRDNWFNALLFGGGFGAALGLLRERDRVVRLLQRVVTAVLAVLAPVLGIGLLIFLVSLPFTGLHALWDATKSTTPILLSCVIGALILANAVIGNGEEEEATNPVLRFGAMALAAAALPLAVIAAIATGLRIDQYGLTPDRLWAVVFVALASAYGLAYLVALLRGRIGWAAYTRPANLRLALVVAAFGLFLATPILSFNALSTADQIARLQSGKIAPEKFDWAALAFDFGDPGKAALKRLARSRQAAVAIKAKEALSVTNRWDLADVETVGEQAALLAKRLRVQPRAVPLPEGLLLAFQAQSDNDPAVLWYESGARSAVLVGAACGTCPLSVAVARVGANGEWKADDRWAPEDRELAARRARAEALKTRGIEIRNVQRRQVYVGGVPIGDPFE